MGQCRDRNAHHDRVDDIETYIQTDMPDPQQEHKVHPRTTCT